MKIRKLSKKGAKTQIVFKPQKGDSWFIDIEKVEIKSGKVTSSSMIIQKDVDQYIKMYKDKGWEEDK